VQILPHSFTYVTVSFTPPSISNYNIFLEAVLENVPSSVKNRSIFFEISGDGNLPRFTVVKPTVRNKKGQALMLFKRSVVNHSDTQQLVFSNDGTLATKINFHFYDPDSAFKIRPFIKDQDKSAATSGFVIKENKDSISSVIIQPGTQVHFKVTCTPRQVQTYQASLQLTVTDNQFEDTMIQMIGEGYMEDVVYENLHSIAGFDELDDEVIADEDVSALKCNSINFGDIYINDKKQLMFTLKNQSKNDCYRFEWPLVPGMASSTATNAQATNTNQNNPNAQQQQQQQQNANNPNDLSTNLAAVNSYLTFAPRVGHLHAGCAKDITVSFKSADPKTIRKELMSCQLVKINFEQPVNEVKDWDDRMTQIKWISEVVHTSNSLSGSMSSEQPILTNSAQQKHQQLNELSANLPGAVGQQANAAAPTATTTNKQIVRKKVIEVEPEPRHVRSDESVQPLELYVSANCDYCRFRCRTNAIRFKDTLMFQTRVFE
jgi:hydrocephalus-inducing protein